jgi:hypothetical protein
MDAVEALTNAVVGLAVSWGVTFWALPLWGLAPTAGQAASITAMYFGLSFVRGWIVRAMFRRAGENRC